MNTSNSKNDGDVNIDAETRHDEMTKSVFIEINSHKIKMLEGLATGLEIKEAAIEQGVNIQLNFVLQLELPNGTARVIGDDDKVPVRDHLGFTAIEPDDNS